MIEMVAIPGSYSTLVSLLIYYRFLSKILFQLWINIT